MKFIINRILFISLMLFYSAFTYSQQFVKVNKNEFKTENETGLEEAWKSIREGDKLFKAGKGTYRDARELYLFAQRYNDKNAELNYKIGVCYLYSDDKYESIKYLRNAYLLKENVSEDIHLLLARAYHLTNEFDRAIEEYNKYLETLHPKKVAVESVQIKRFIEECKNGKVLVENPLRVIINNMGSNVNSQADDYNSIFTANDDLMYFTSRRKHHDKARRSAYDNKYFEDIYISRKIDGEWGRAENIGKTLNNPKHNNAAVGLSPDNQHLFIYRGHKDGGDIYESKYKEGEWKSPRSLPSRFNTKYRETSLSISPDQKYMFFVSSNPKESIGGRDIYVAMKNFQGRWEKPENMGDKINTPYDEECVHISPDGNTLYFSSKGHNSMGGYDVFKSEKNDLGEWSPPVNIGYPINTPDDDVFYTIPTSGKSAYYSANRMGGLGGRDIYRVVFLGAEKEIIMSTEDILIAGTEDLTKTGFFTKPQEISIDTTFILAGKVFDVGTMEGVMAQLEFIDVDQSRVVATTLSNQTGDYTARLPEGKAYGIEINAQGYLFYLDIVDISGESPEEKITRDFGLEKVEVGTTVVLENIFFETNKATLKPESYTQLEQVLKFMNSNPSVRMEISGHTDNTGSLKYNTKLSQSRAEAVVQYMVERGIEAARFDAKGYAFTQPIAPNDTQEGRAKNRRVEFKILSK